MNYEFLEVGVNSIADFFGGKYKPEAVRMVSGSVLVESDVALKYAYKRCITEFNNLPPIAKVRDIIIQEGKKIREQQAIEREEEAKRQNKDMPRTLPSGSTEYSRACCSFLKAAFSGYYDKSELRKMAIEGEKKFPCMGFDAWLNGSLKNVTEVKSEG